MKALTVSQPYAGLLADQLKWVENRTWETKYRGWVAIHAGKGTQYLTKQGLEGYPTGCIVAVSYLVACFTIEELLSRMKKTPNQLVVNYLHSDPRTVREILDHEHTEGPVCLIFGDTLKLPKPIPCKGAQRFWETPEAISLELQQYEPFDIPF